MPNAGCRIAAVVGCVAIVVRVQRAALRIRHWRARRLRPAAELPHRLLEAVGPPSSLKPEQLKDVSFKQRLNERLPLDASFKDEYGRPVTLGKYFGGKRPVILAFVYYQCPMLCSR